MTVVLLLAVATAATHLLAHQLDRQARTVVHPELAAITIAAGAYLVAFLTTIAFAVALAVEVAS